MVNASVPPNGRRYAETMNKPMRKQHLRHAAQLGGVTLCVVGLLLLGGEIFAQPAPSMPDSAGRGDSRAYQYEADSVEHDLQTNRIRLTGNAVVRYQDVTLKAGRITFDSKAGLVTAEPLPDSTGSLTVGVPEFSRGSERFTGLGMHYNLETGRGRVTGGKAHLERKYYRGEDILLRQRKELHARHVSMSTCEHDHPHYDFLCGDLKAIENDKAIARSVTFRIGPVPVFWIPYYVFPLKKGRHSGILTPAIGSNSRDGISVRNLGYYLAPSDYWDATLAATVRETNGFLVDAGFRYAVRRRLDGDLNLSFENGSLGSGATRRDWRLNVRHRQQIDPTLSLRADGTFSSSTTFDERNSEDLYDYLNRQLRSTLSMAKSWNVANRSLDASLAYYRDLESDQNRFQGFPRISFRQGRRRIFAPTARAGQGTRGVGSTGTRGSRWYHAFYYNVSGGLTNNYTRNPAGANNTEDLQIDGRLGVNSQHRAFGWLDLTPNLNVTQSMSRNNQDRPTRRESYATSMSTGTTFYGIFAPHIGRLRGIRHRLQPRVDFRYTQGATIEGGTFGFGGARDWGEARRSFNGSLANALEIKTEVDGKEHRSTLATLNVSSGYDLDAVGQKWRPLSTSASVKPDRRLDIRFTASHSLYDSSGTRALLSPRLQSLSLTTGLRLVGGRAGADSGFGGIGSRDFRGNAYGGAYGSSDFGVERAMYDGLGDSSEPWRLYVSHHYDVDKRFGATRRTSWIKADIGLTPLPGWRTDYSVNYDLEDTRITSQSLAVYRRLHCWEARLAWYPSGFNQGVYFKINVRDIPQIKFEHRQGGYGL